MATRPGYLCQQSRDLKETSRASLAWVRAMAVLALDLRLDVEDARAADAAAVERTRLARPIHFALLAVARAGWTETRSLAVWLGPGAAAEDRWGGTGGSDVLEDGWERRRGRTGPRSWSRRCRTCCSKGGVAGKSAQGRSQVARPAGDASDDAAAASRGQPCRSPRRACGRPPPTACGADQSMPDPRSQALADLKQLHMIQEATAGAALQPA